MPSNSKVGRYLVTNRVHAPFTAPADCIVQIFGTEDVQVHETPASEIYWHLEKDQCELHLGIPLPVGTKINVPLEAGESIWFITEDIGLVGWAVSEWL